MIAPSIAAQEIDAGARLQHAQLHTVSHLIADLVHQRHPELQGAKGNHFPGGQSSVTFKGPCPDKAQLKAQLEADLAAAIAADSKARTFSLRSAECAHHARCEVHQSMHLHATCIGTLQVNMQC